ncbi:hypothetical protein DH2020_028947 [Rehmannia glutinosa]|uniref:Transmembrane protein n=1 Tax=Rehmannia glutinosa TaxID=99300 RepID=A0ABR0VSX7_REHGL
METKTSNFYFIVLFLFLHLRCSINCLKDNFDESLDTIFHDHAFRVMIHHHPHTGALYNATLPTNLAGIKVSVVRLRSRTLWKKGANFSNFIIPPKTHPLPYVKRILIVYHSLGNWSSLYYNLSGYSLVSPVLGFLVYNASNLSSKNLLKIELNNTLGKPISVEFQNSTLANGRRFCASFGEFGEVLLSEMSLPNVCYSKNLGRFSIVIPFKKQQGIIIRQFWVMGFVGLVLVGLAGAVAVRSFVGKMNQEMGKEADEGECLKTYWIGNSKMPRAEVIRTQPVLESTIPPNPKMSWYA